MTLRNSIEKTFQLRPRHYRALTTLAIGGDLEDAAEAAGISIISLRRWLREPVFRGELSRLTGERAEHAGRKLTALVDKAVCALERILDDEDSAAYVQVQAARTTLEMVLRWRESVAFEERLQRLEDAHECDMDGD